LVAEELGSMTRTIFSRPLNPAPGNPVPPAAAPAGPEIDAVGGTPKPLPETADG